MDFGLTDDQREIQRTARDLLVERATPERVREHAEARTTDEALWRELCELGWPGIAIAEEHGGQGLGQIELSILCEELGRSLAPVPFLPSVMAGSGDRAGRLARAARALAAGLGLAARRSARSGSAVDGAAELVIGGADAQVIVLVEDDGTGRVLGADEADVQRRWQSIDPTRSAARVSAPDGAGEALEGDVARRRRPRARRRSAPSSSASATGRWR